MAEPTNPEELKDYCLRKLGQPVINIEIDDSQCYDRIDEAIDFFIERHYDGCTETWEAIEITESDIRNNAISLSEDWIAVVGIIDGLSKSGQSGDAFDRVQYNVVNSDMVRMATSGGGGMVQFQVMHERLDLIKRMFSPTRRFRHNATTGKLVLQGSWKAVGAGILVHGYKGVNRDRTASVYSHRWLKKYATALIGKQWGTNISKYDGVQLPGGVVMQGDKIYDRYSEEIQKLEEEFFDKYELPTDFFMA